MAIKSTLISTVNSFLTVVVTIAKVKSSLLEMVNNFYGTTISENQDTVSKVITERNLAVSDIGYTVNFTKQGRNVFVSGVIINDTDIIDNWDFFEIVAPEYLPAVNTNIPFIGITDSSNNVYLSAEDNKLYCVLGANTSTNFSLTYTTKD